MAIYSKQGERERQRERDRVRQKETQRERHGERQRKIHIALLYFLPRSMYNNRKIYMYEILQYCLKCTSTNYLR